MLKRSVLLLLIAHVWLLPGQNNFRPMKDTEAFKLKVAGMSKETRTIESDFTQTKNLAMLSEKIISRGSFCFKKQNNLRWEYSEPYKYVIVINKDKVLIKDENNKVKKFDMGSNKVFKEINDIMLSCIEGSILGSDKFDVSYFESEKNYKLELVPRIKAMKESLKKISLYFDKNVTSVIRLEMAENGDDLTTIDFVNRKLNADIGPEKFILK